MQTIDFLRRLWWPLNGKWYDISFYRRIPNTAMKVCCILCMLWDFFYLYRQIAGSSLKMRNIFMTTWMYFEINFRDGEWTKDMYKWFITNLNFIFNFKMHAVHPIVICKCSDASLIVCRFFYCYMNCSAPYYINALYIIDDAHDSKPQTDFISLNNIIDLSTDKSKLLSQCRINTTVYDSNRYISRLLYYNYHGI